MGEIAQTDIGVSTNGSGSTTDALTTSTDRHLEGLDWLIKEIEFYRKNRRQEMKKVEKRLGWDLSNRKINTGFFAGNNGISRLLKKLAANNELYKFEELMAKRHHYPAINFQYFIVEEGKPLHDQFPYLKQFKDKLHYITPLIIDNGFDTSTWTLFYKR